MTFETLFQGKYRTKSNRRPFWYFITVCTKYKEHYFGEIIDGEIQLNELGKIVNDELLKTETMREKVILDSFIVMPNHVHVIIVFDPPRPVETQCIASLPNKFGPQINNLASIIRGFKSSVTQYARLHQITFQWQSNYYDHIVRDDDDLKRIRRYIDENPQNWDRDCNNPEGLFM